MLKRKATRAGKQPWRRLTNALTGRAFFGEVKSAQTEGTWLSSNWLGALETGIPEEIILNFLTVF